MLHQSVERVKTKSQKVLGPNFYVCRSYRGKTGRGVEVGGGGGGGGGFLSPLILNRVKFEYLGAALKYKICSKCM